MMSNKCISWCVILLIGLMSTSVFSAGFTDNHNDNVLNGWTINGNRTWSESAGSALTQNGSNSAGFLINDYDAADDGVIEVTATADQWNGNRGGVVFRWTSSSSYYYVGVLPGNQWSSGIYFCENTTDLLNAQVVAGPFQIGSTFTLKIEIEGSTFKFYLNDVYQGQTTDASHSSGKVGYAHSNSWNSFISFDNITWTDQAPATFELTTATNGSGSVSPESGTYQNGETVTLTATPVEGWVFDHWSGDASDAENPVNITMDADKSITANFTEITYDLQVTIDGQGSVSPASGTYPQGATITLTATPAEGWLFDHWSGDASGIENPFNTTMDTDKNISAVFTEITHDLQVTVDGQGSVSPASGTYPQGTPVPLTATPAEGWLFDHWDGDISSAENPVSVTMDADKNITAYFTEIPMYDLTTTVNGQGAVSPESGNYSEGTPVTITASAAEGWLFDHWSGDASGASNPITITMNSNTSIVANFIEEIVEYSLTSSVTGNGSVDPANGTFTEGTPVEITAIPDEGWVFAHWSGDATGSTNPLTITMDTNKSIIANFAQITHDLAVVVDGQGTVSPESGTYPEGTPVELTATPAEGWSFDHWSGDATGNTNPVAVTMDANKSVTAHFSLIPTFELTTTIDGQGTVTPASGTFPEGTPVELTATPAEGWSFDHWSGDVSGIENPITITMDANKNITAHFIEIPTFELTTTVDGPGSITPESGTYPEATDVVVTATADDGYMFDHWSGDVSGDENPLQITMDADKNITAHFVEYIPPVPNREKLAITAKLFDNEGNPVGVSSPVSLNVTVRLYTDESAGFLKYTETFLQIDGQGVTVENGRFIVRLRDGTSSDDLKMVLEENPHLWVEISIDSDAMARVPLTGAAYLLTESY